MIENQRISVDQTKMGSRLSPEAQNLPGFLHTPKSGDQVIGQRVRETRHELPWMAHAAKYIAMGTMSQKEVAELCQVSEEQIYVLLRTPWFLERVRELMDSEDNDVMALLRGAGTSAAVTIIEICNNPKASHTSRLAAAKEILDRNLGKSVTLIDSKVQHLSNDPVADVRAAEEELRRLRSNGSINLVQLPS